MAGVHQMLMGASAGEVVKPPPVVEVLVVAGGGGGKGGGSDFEGNAPSGCGGGAGGMLIHAGFTLVAGTTYPVTIGAGGAGDTQIAYPGSNSTALGITAFGGGALYSSQTRGSGAGGTFAWDDAGTQYVAPQPAGQTSNGGATGYASAGGTYRTSGQAVGGGGGGAGGAGGPGTGGAGRVWAGITYAAGGTCATGATPPPAGTANTGSGGGGATTGTHIIKGTNGGSGVVRLRWPNSGPDPKAYTGATLSDDGTYKYLNFTSTGSFSF